MSVIKTIWDNPWYLMITFLSTLVIVSSFIYDPLKIIPFVLASVITTTITDSTIRRIKFGSWSYPVGATVSGLIISIALLFTTPIYVVILTAFIAMILKNTIKINGTHVFNPANLGLLIMGIFLKPELAWWGVTSTWIMLLFLITIYKVKRYSVVISFLVMFSLIEIITSSFNFNLLYANIIGLIFWMMVMIVEPITSPSSTKSQIIFGVIIAIATSLFNAISFPYFMLAGLAFADLFVPLLRKYAE